jgi:hypothetical protein
VLYLDDDAFTNCTNNEGESIHSQSDDDHDETNRPYHFRCSLSYRQSQGMVTLITSSVWFGHRIFNWLDDDAGLAWDHGSRTR